MNRCSLSWSSRSALVAPLINYIRHRTCLTSYVYQHRNILKAHQLPSRVYLDSSPPTPPKFPASPWHHFVKDVGLHQHYSNNIKPCNGKLHSKLYSTTYSIGTMLNCYSVNSQPVWKIMYHIIQKCQGLTL
jgi:hypothetical protein